MQFSFSWLPTFNSGLLFRMIRPWKTIRSAPVGDFRIFKIRADICVNPRTGREHEFFILDSVNWVNVIAVTPDQKLVMVEQYRHGSATVELEIPGGMMDPHETDPVATAVRELREETGYAGENARLLGRVHSNPAILSNLTCTVLIENCRLRHGVEFDQGEDLETRLLPVAEIPKLVADEKISHSLVVAALYHFDLWQRGLKQPGPKLPGHPQKILARTPPAPRRARPS
jgi:8-oxo-dGTP pyrophosphatase MutT (NUDIX family)